MLANQIIHDLQSRLNRAMHEEYILGRHKDLDDRITNHIIQAANELQELRDNNDIKTVSLKKDPEFFKTNEGYTIILNREEGEIVYNFPITSILCIYRTMIPSLYNLPSRPDTNYNTWYIKHIQDCITKERFVLEPHEGHVLKNLLGEAQD